jgi:hypothetical protein
MCDGKLIFNETEAANYNCICLCASVENVLALTLIQCTHGSDVAFIDAVKSSTFACTWLFMCKCCLRQYVVSDGSDYN